MGIVPWLAITTIERVECLLNRASKSLVFLFLLLLFLPLQPVAAEDRSFSISDVDIHARIDTAGDMHVTELDTYLFDGAFNGILIDLDSSKSDGIEDFQAVEVSEQGDIALRFELSSDGTRHNYRVFSGSQDESKLFRITYTVKNAVKVYADTAELYWKFFDERNESTLENVNITVELPDGIVRDDIRAFGHGPNNGKFQIEDNGNVSFTVSPLAPRSLLEVRVLFPGAVVPNSTRISNELMLEAILEEEQNWATSGDHTVPWAAALLVINVIFGVYARKYRDSKSAWSGKYYRELPRDITPAVVGYLQKFKRKPRDLMATMLDLVRKKTCHLEEGDQC